VICGVEKGTGVGGWEKENMGGPRRGGDDDEGRGTGASVIRNLIRI